MSSLSSAKAIEIFNEINKEIAANDSKVTLGALWEKLVGLAPDIIKLGGAADVVARFVNG